MASKVSVNSRLNTLFWSKAECHSSRSMWERLLTSGWQGRREQKTKQDTRCTFLGLGSGPTSSNKASPATVHWHSVMPCIRNPSKDYSIGWLRFLSYTPRVDHWSAEPQTHPAFTIIMADSAERQNSPVFDALGPQDLDFDLLCSFSSSQALKPFH